jgi:hypothetical protein
MAEQYYWVDKGSTFGGGDDGIQAGEKMPANFSEDARFESFKAKGLISTEKVASKRQLSELEQLKKENAELKKNQGGVSQADLDTAKEESVQADLDLIVKMQDQLAFVIDAVENIQQGDKKEEIWEAVKGIKDLLKDGE